MAGTKERGRFAIVTMVMLNDSYTPGAVALARSAKASGTMADLVCMVTKSVSSEARTKLEAEFDHVYEVKEIKCDNAPPMIGGQKRYQSLMLSIFTKFRILELEQYDKVLWMDADMIILKPIDDLFTLDAPAACFDHQMSKHHVEDYKYPAALADSLRSRRGWLENFYFPPNGKLKHGEVVSTSAIKGLYHKQRQFAAQGGLCLLRPSANDLECFIGSIPLILANLPSSVISGADELAITLFYYNNGISWRHIDMCYNVSALHLYPIYREQTKVLHYINYKPWNETEEQVAKHYPAHLAVWRLWNQFYPRKEEKSEKIK